MEILVCGADCESAAGWHPASIECQQSPTWRIAFGVVDGILAVESIRPFYLAFDAATGTRPSAAAGRRDRHLDGTSTAEIARLLEYQNAR